MVCEFVYRVEESNLPVKYLCPDWIFEMLLAKIIFITRFIE